MDNDLLEEFKQNLLAEIQKRYKLIYVFGNDNKMYFNRIDFDFYERFTDIHEMESYLCKRDIGDKLQKLLIEKEFISPDNKEGTIIELTINKLGRFVDIDFDILNINCVGIRIIKPTEDEYERIIDDTVWRITLGAYINVTSNEVGIVGWGTKASNGKDRLRNMLNEDTDLLNRVIDTAKKEIIKGFSEYKHNLENKGKRQMFDELCSQGRVKTITDVEISEKKDFINIFPTYPLFEDFDYFWEANNYKGITEIIEENSGINVRLCDEIVLL